MAQANGMAFVSRDKLLSEVNNQKRVVSEVISALKTVPLPSKLIPNRSQLEEFLTLNDYRMIRQKKRF